MDEFELERFCERNPQCDCRCMRCAAFALYQRHELGLDEYNDDEK